MPEPTEGPVVVPAHHSPVTARGGLLILATVLYHVALLAFYGWIGIQQDCSNLPDWLQHHRELLRCTLMGGLGGGVYCLRAVYLNACVRKSWEPEWWPWYAIRPVVSLCSGFASFIFLRAGLLVLDASQQQHATSLGFYALAFIAGLNVDKFIGKIEEVAQAVWGIPQSRTAATSRADV